MENEKPEEKEKNIAKGIRNLFRLKKELDYKQLKI